jgi:hypothetical protein
VSVDDELHWELRLLLISANNSFAAAALENVSTTTTQANKEDVEQDDALHLHL